MTSDVFSLGSVLYEVWTNSPVFLNDEDPRVVMGDVCAGKMPPIGKIGRPKRSLIELCWSFNPIGRPTANQIWDMHRMQQPIS
jgi:hypothetical protein